MTARDPDRLFRLLPAVHRRRDAEAGGVTRALLRTVTEQVELVEDDLEQLYRNFFIETCDEWVVPYLGDLVGYRMLPGVDGGKPNPALVAPRADVANTIGYRRRKGTLALLERLAADVARLPARAVEFYELLAATQCVRLFGTDEAANAARLARGRTVDMRHGLALERLDGPFDEIAHTVEVSRISSSGPHRRGRPNVGHVGVFVWRLGAYSLTNVDAPRFGADPRHDYTLSPLGNDAPLVTKPVAEQSPTHIADPTNVPAFVTRRVFAANTADYYGPGKTVCLWRDSEVDPVPLAQIVCADLTNWSFEPIAGTVAVDPALGRVSFPDDTAPSASLRATFHYGFGADMGGGEYRRETAAPTYRVGPDDHTAIADALTAWQADRTANPDLRKATIEVTDNAVYAENLDLELAPGDQLTIRAANGARPLVRLPAVWSVTGPATPGEACGLTLDGLLVDGGGIAVSGALDAFTVRHCTLVPGHILTPDNRPGTPDAISLLCNETTADVTIEHTVLGPIEVITADDTHEPAALSVSDSIVVSHDATTPALAAPDGRHAFVALAMARTTVWGAVAVHEVNLIENSICVDAVTVARRQDGCVRFSWLGEKSRTPRRYHCQPDLAIAATGGDPDAERLAAARTAPVFTSEYYGTPAFAQLHTACADEITRGADDAAEMGAFHDLYQPQRLDGLRIRLAEYVPATTDVGIILVT